MKPINFLKKETKKELIIPRELFSKIKYIIIPLLIIVGILVDNYYLNSEVLSYTEEKKIVDERVAEFESQEIDNRYSSESSAAIIDTHTKSISSNRDLLQILKNLDKNTDNQTFVTDLSYEYPELKISGISYGEEAIDQLLFSLSNDDLKLIEVTYRDGYYNFIIGGEI